MKIIKVKSVSIKLLKNPGMLCIKPYPGHPNGCPNYGKLGDCPPNAPKIWHYFDKKLPLCLVVISFDMDRHVERMKAKHPRWSDRQLRNCYYWQNGVRSKLRRKCEALCSNRGFDAFALKPEAMGVNVFRTMRKFGIKLKRNPTDMIYKIALVGYRKTSKKRWRF